MIVLKPEDEILSNIVNGCDDFSMIFKVLQQAVLDMGPVYAFAKVGGEQGMRITRAAFAVMLKYNDSIS